MSDFIFTSESVTEGHPDKICDQISDAVLDALLTEDPESRVACETVVNTGLCLLTGEITSKAKVDYIKLVRNVIKEIGYEGYRACLLYTSPSPRDKCRSRMPSSA